MQRENVLGVGISAVNMRSAIDTIFDWIEAGRRTYVCITGVHGVIESLASPELRDIHNRAGMVTPDGMPMAWMLWLGGHRHADRVCGPELMPDLVAASQKRGSRHFFYGSSPETLAKLKRSLRQAAPAATIAGFYSPPFRALTAAEDDAIVERINAASPDIVWVGLSTPKQEHWMAAHRSRLHAPVLIGVGAAFDIQAGVVPRAPRFMRRTGFEWTYRFCKEPRRLTRRYLHSHPRFVAMIALQKLGLYRPPLLES